MRRRKRGISTIIGALFFTFVVIAALTMMSWASQQQGSFSTTTTEVNTLQLERMRSDLEITDVRIDSNKFNITLQNNGPLTERIVRLWATNETDTNWHNKYELNNIAGPKQTLTNLGQDIPLMADNLDGYKLKFVTERGNLLTFRSLSVAQADLKLSMYIIPSTIATGENVTIMMSVTNNVKDVDSIHDLQPALGISYTCIDSVCPTATQESAPSGIKSLARGSTGLFKWTYTVGGPSYSKVEFTGTLIGADPSKSVSDSVTIKPVIADIVNVTSLITNSTGILSMNFTSFHFCKPDISDCTSDSAGWQPGWRVESGSQAKYLWRINVTNLSPRDIFLDETSAILLLHAQTGGGGNEPTVMYIKDDSTPTDEDPPGSYLNCDVSLFDCKVLRADDAYYTIYFGSSIPGEATLVNIKASGMYAVNLILFGFVDVDDDHVYDPAIDNAPYSQNLPFQGLNAT